MFSNSLPDIDLKQKKVIFNKSNYIKENIKILEEILERLNLLIDKIENKNVA